ncbi:MAG TPA: VanZ family protein [Candidatus Saccharimonadales bacterium]|nr:VanZ family protein [Candidatus Saccharimonadales bacterium]
MKKQLLVSFILFAYSVILVTVMVFRHVPLIRIGHLIFNFGGTDANGQANVIPFKTILPYLLGKSGLIIGGINLIGNIIPLVPIGFLVPFIYQNMTWKKSVILSFGCGFVIEGMQVILHTGIFDIDDVILNGFGVIIGYWIFTRIAKKKKLQASL